MKTIIVASNGVAVLSSILCASHLYRTRWRIRASRLPVAALVICGVTILLSGVQFVMPEVLAALRRDPEALSNGEWWRLVTPLFVQPGGWIQLIVNIAFLFTFLPVAECVYRSGLWLIYFASGIVGQVVNYAWSPHGGGSSTAAFGAMGSILVCVLLSGRDAPLPYRVFAIMGLVASIVMSFAQDGHGPGMLAGAIAGTIISVLSERSRTRRYRQSR
jgi:membrane associated rhomboid family serine protease